MMDSSAGYREIEHMADWELEFWAPNLAGLLEQAARGMYTLTETRLANHPRLSIDLHLQAADPESLIVAFLSELLWIGERDGLGFDLYAVTVQEGVMSARLEGARILDMSKTIKAVTYHNLKVEETPVGLRASIVFDV